MLYTKQYRKAGLTGSYGLIIFIRLSVLKGYRYSYRIRKKKKKIMIKEIEDRRSIRKYKPDRVNKTIIEDMIYSARNL